MNKSRVTSPGWGESRVAWAIEVRYRRPYDRLYVRATYSPIIVINSIPIVIPVATPISLLYLLTQSTWYLACVWNTSSQSARGGVQKCDIIVLYHTANFTIFKRGVQIWSYDQIFGLMTKSVGVDRRHDMWGEQTRQFKRGVQIWSCDQICWCWLAARHVRWADSTVGYFHCSITYDIKNRIF